jgi:iron complex outermembrane recepter protein
MLVTLVISFITHHQVFNQNTYTLSGFITDGNNTPLAGASVILQPGKKGATANPAGRYLISDLPRGKYTIEVSHMGYLTLKDSLTISSDGVYDARLKPTPITLQEVVVVDLYAEKLKREESLNVEIVNSQFIRQYQAGSLMKTLERIPGVSTIDIGAGQSKPVIRGLSFNRVVVIDHGIKHEGQQWGTDHGLEIDQYAIGSVMVVKGPASLMYGSDAIGGAIVLQSNGLPATNSIYGSVDLMGKSNNNLLGTSFSLTGRREALWAGLRATIIDYADYKVPADSIDIYSYKAPIHKNRLRNTAGKEQNLHFNLGFIGQHFNSRIIISNLNSRSGFFANAHGLEPRSVDTNLHDKSNRDILYPRQEVNHLKAIHKNQWVGDGSVLDLDFGFQYNFRQEWSQYVNHGWMPPIFPDTLSFPQNLERGFEKYIYSTNLRFTLFQSENRDISLGLNTEYQDNRIDGRGFIIPGYTQGTLGGYAFVKQKLSEKSLVNIGVRYDAGQIQTKAYHDWFMSPNDDESEWKYLPRASEINRQFSAFSWSMGYNHNRENLSLKANIGKSFRIPIAKELAANGVNYHHFSYEIGDLNLSPEVSYQFDLGVEYNSERFVISINPFVNYFTNYIYLNPTHEINRSQGGGHQVFVYSEAEVFRVGGELHAHYLLTKNLKLGIIGEYIYSQQMSGPKRGFSLPFSPAPAALVSLKYQRDRFGFVNHPYVFIDHKLTATQYDIVPPEEITAGYQELNIGLGGQVRTIILSLQINNVFNSKHFNHASYYRLINVPEPGRNFTIHLSKPFKY